MFLPKIKSFYSLQVSFIEFIIHFNNSYLLENDFILILSFKKYLVLIESKISIIYRALRRFRDVRGLKATHNFKICILDLEMGTSDGYFFYLRSD